MFGVREIIYETNGLRTCSRTQCSRTGRPEAGRSETKRTKPFANVTVRERVTPTLHAPCTRATQSDILLNNMNMRVCVVRGLGVLRGRVAGLEITCLGFPV